MIPCDVVYPGVLCDGEYDCTNGWDEIDQACWPHNGFLYKLNRIKSHVVVQYLKLEVLLHILFIVLFYNKRNQTKDKTCAIFPAVLKAVHYFKPKFQLAKRAEKLKRMLQLLMKPEYQFLVLQCVPYNTS